MHDVLVNVTFAALPICLLVGVHPIQLDRHDHAFLMLLSHNLLQIFCICLIHDQYRLVMHFDIGF